MPSAPPTPPPSDVCLLLRADAERCWLDREVIPVLRELEAPEALAEEQVGAALAYLEATWGEATIRARATDAARGELRCAGERGEDSLSAAAGRYHAAVRVLRELVAARVSTLVQPAQSDGAYESAQTLLVDAPAGGGCAPRAA